MGLFRVLKVTVGMGMLALACQRLGIFQACSLPALNASAIPSLLSGGTPATHYAPSEDLERIDLAQLAESTSHLDIAMYAFTDKSIARELVRLAELGVVIRLYRDGEQYEEEQSRGGSTTDMLRGQRNIHIRVKPASRSDLMHLKAYSDGHVLRDGSANWSVAGLRRQDNNLTLTTNSASVANFERSYDEMWERPDNRDVQ